MNVTPAIRSRLAPIRHGLPVGPARSTAPPSVTDQNGTGTSPDLPTGTSPNLLKGAAVSWIASGVFSVASRRETGRTPDEAIWNPCVRCPDQGGQLSRAVGL